MSHNDKHREYRGTVIKTFEGASQSTTLSLNDVLDNDFIRFAGATNIALTMPDAAQIGDVGLTVWFVNDGTGTMTVEASATFGGLGGSTTMTPSQGQMTPVVCGSAYWYTLGTIT